LKGRQKEGGRERREGEEMERRWRGDGEEMERRWRGDGEEMERRWRESYSWSAIKTAVGIREPNKVVYWST